MKTNQNDDQQGRSAGREVLQQGFGSGGIQAGKYKTEEKQKSRRVKHRSKVCWTSKETMEGHYRPGLPILHQMGKIEATAILVIFG